MLEIKINKETAESELKKIIEKINNVQDKIRNLEAAVEAVRAGFNGEAADRILNNLGNMVLKTQTDVETILLFADLLREYCDQMVVADNNLKSHFDGSVL